LFSAEAVPLPRFSEKNASAVRDTKLRADVDGFLAPFGEPLGRLAGETTVACTTGDFQAKTKATTGIEPV
jgi:hypothetical protein